MTGKLLLLTRSKSHSSWRPMAWFDFADEAEREIERLKGYESCAGDQWRVVPITVYNDRAQDWTGGKDDAAIAAEKAVDAIIPPLGPSPVDLDDDDDEDHIGELMEFEKEDEKIPIGDHLKNQR